MKPLFAPGEKVLFKAKDRAAVIVRCINVSDQEDVWGQGFRYYVLMDGWTWSAAESELSAL